MIEVRLFATLREGREKTQYFDPAAFVNAGDIVASLGSGADEVAILLINGRHSKPGAPVKDGDVVALFPPVGGG